MKITEETHRTDEYLGEASTLSLREGIVIVGIVKPDCFAAAIVED